MEEKDRALNGKKHEILRNICYCVFPMENGKGFVPNTGGFGCGTIMD